MIISRKELLEAAENGTPILNHLDELTEDAMKAIFFERVPICEGSISTKPLISPSKERVLTNNLGRNEYVIYKGTCTRCGETVEFKLTRTDIVTHSFPFYRGISEFGSRRRKARPLYHESSGLTDFIAHGPYSSHELLVKKEGVKILCEACYNELIGEIEKATRDFLSGDVLEWANDCNNGLIPQEDLWKKEIFTLWKVHKETQRVVELKIDDRYYWLDEALASTLANTLAKSLEEKRKMLSALTRQIKAQSIWKSTKGAILSLMDKPANKQVESLQDEVAAKQSENETIQKVSAQQAQEIASMKQELTELRKVKEANKSLAYENSVLQGQVWQLQSDLGKEKKKHQSWLSDFTGIAEDLIDHAGPELLQHYESRGLPKLIGQNLWDDAKATKEERTAERKRLSQSSVRGRHM